jgi:hypothetical protein
MVDQKSSHKAGGRADHLLQAQDPAQAHAPSFVAAGSAANVFVNQAFEVMGAE